MVFSVSGFERMVENSPRAGGNYTVSLETRELLGEIYDERHKARITTYLINQRRMGVTWPRLTGAIIAEARVARGLTADERAERILGFLAEKTGNLGSNVRLNKFEPSSDNANITESHKAVFNNTCQALAISESSEFEELNQSQGGMCIWLVMGTWIGVTQELLCP